ncbi:MAG: type II toxin-antitoxin system Phd/YefM family antitoxin [Candidatus Binatia bacterium]
MKSVNALELRQSLGKVLRTLERDGGPILVERARRPSAVLISLKDYNERFVDRTADDERRAIVQRIEEMAFRAPRGRTSLDVLRSLRNGA